jgi:predicted nucleic acid-binding Zn ribbon protein
MFAAPLKRCKICGSKVNRIFYPVSIAFKGSGFYATDNRSRSASPTFGDKSEGDAKSDSGEVKAAKPDAKSKPKSDSKPKSGSATKTS